MDETLRMGLPAWRRSSSLANRLTLIGGALAACLLLALAIYQVLRTPDADVDPYAGTQKPGTSDLAVNPADGNDNKSQTGKPQTTPEDKNGKKPTPPDQGNKTDNGGQKPIDQQPKDKTKPDNGGKEPDDKTKPPDKNGKPAPEPVLKDIPIAAPSTAVKDAGRLENDFGMGERGLILQKQKSGKWKLVELTSPVVKTGQPMLSLPGYQTPVSLNGDALRLKLAGAAPEEIPYPVLSREALVELHHTDQIDLDLTLHRGKIVLTNRTDKPAQVRLRFANTTDPELGEVWDLLLKGKGTEVFVERNTAIAPGEPFYTDPKHNDRKGPVTAVHVIVRQGKVDLRREKVTHQLQAPPGEARFYWVSTTGVGKEKLTQVPEYATEQADFSEPKMPADVKPDMQKQIQEYHKRFLETRLQMKQARKRLADDLLVNADKLDSVLKSMAKSDKFAERILAVRCYGAVDSLDALVDALGTKDLVDVRRAAIDTLRRWISYERDNDHELYDVLTDRSNYTTNDAVSLITMLHGFSAKDALTSSAIYEALIPKLNHEKLALRELAALQLYLELPRHFPHSIGLEEINYSPDAPEEVRAMAVQQWQQLLAAGKLPPRSK
jgi:hypothetical protein